jgi:O-antigen/teichoic acid export membrane protein
MMTQKRSSYRQIFKATSLFGGVQIVSVITGILRSKFVAIFLGPVGMGISGLLVATVTMINTISGMGLNYSAVRNIAQANESGDTKKLSSTLLVFRRWLWISCLAGSVLLVVFSPLLSQYTFGNKNYTWSFIILSLMLIFTTLTNGNTALLEGTRNLKYTAKSSVIGSFTGLFTVVPLYYFWGIKGIVPALVIGAGIAYLVSIFFARKIKTSVVNVSRKETVAIGGEMAKLGTVIVAAQLIGYVVIYIINTFIRGRGGLADVGLYQAATSLTNQSIGLVFSAMGIDYFPRLAAVCNDNQKVKETVNQQGIITILVSSPILIALIVFAPVFIHILLSKDFYSISAIIRWLAFGSIFTVPMIVIGYISLAKGDKKSYFLYSSLLNNVFSLLFYICGYILGGLIGMAISFFLFQLTYAIFFCYKFYKLYSFSFNNQFLKVFATFTFLCLMSIISSMFFNKFLGYLIGSLILAVATYFSWVKIDEFLDLGNFLKEKIFKKLKQSEKND